MDRLMKRNIRGIIPGVIFLLLAAAVCVPAAEKQVIRPTLYSMDFFGYIDAAHVGDELTVYDGQGVLCGRFTIDKEGRYGFLHVYGDDKTTAADEGADPNEPLVFYLNDSPLTPVSYPQIRWLGDGQKLQVDFTRR